MTVGVAILGCGTVGSAVARLLTSDSEALSERLGATVELISVFARSEDRVTRQGLPAGLFRGDLQQIVADPAVQVVVELLGGTDFAFRAVMAALEAGKDVVTANKALLAVHGRTILVEARRRGRVVAFEASCGGGIPILRALYDGLVANRIDAIYGIVNGTCNYILSEMIDRGRSYPEALAEAKELGLAEVDPSLDVSGMDSAHKVAIMASLAFGTSVVFDDVSVEGIEDIALIDVQRGRELGYVVKLIGAALRWGDRMALWVRPAFIAEDHPLAWIKGPFNAVSVYGSATGHTMYYGRGAGGGPTASAVVADLAAIAGGAYERQFAGRSYWLDAPARLSGMPAEERTSRFYLRLAAEDRPGSLAAITTVLGRNEIGISSVLQHEREGAVPTSGEASYATVVVITNEVFEGRLRRAVDELETLACTTGRVRVIAVLDEHEEWSDGAR